MRGAVPDEEQRIGVGAALAPLRRHDRERAVAVEHRGEVTQLAIDLGTDRGLGEAGADRGGHLGGGHRCGELLD